MNNQNKIILGIVISYFLIVSLVALKTKRPDTGNEEKNEDDEIKQEQKKE